MSRKTGAKRSYKPKTERDPRNRAQRRLRRKGGVVSITLGPDDMGFVIRGKSGTVQIHHSRGNPTVGTAGFYGYMLEWLFDDSEAATEIRATLQEEFLQDLNALREKARLANLQAHCEREATKRIEAMLEDGSITEDNADAHKDDLVKTMMTEIEEDRVKAETERLAYVAELEKLRDLTEADQMNLRAYAAMEPVERPAVDAS